MGSTRTSRREAKGKSNKNDSIKMMQGNGSLHHFYVYYADQLMSFTACKFKMVFNKNPSDSWIKVAAGTILHFIDSL